MWWNEAEREKGMDKQFLSGCVCASECIPKGAYVMLCSHIPACLLPI